MLRSTTQQANTARTIESDRGASQSIAGWKSGGADVYRYVEADNFVSLHMALPIRDRAQTTASEPANHRYHLLDITDNATPTTVLRPALPRA